VAIMIAVIILRMLSAPSRIGSLLLESAPLVAIGRISYSLYLFHVPFMIWLWPRNSQSVDALNAVLILGATFAVALLSYYCVERPCLRLKSRLAKPGVVDVESERRFVTMDIIHALERSAP